MILVFYLAIMKSMTIISAVDILLPVCLPSILCVAAHWRTSVASVDDCGMQAVMMSMNSFLLRPHCVAQTGFSLTRVRITVRSHHIRQQTVNS